VTDAGHDATAPCAVAVDGGMVACTTQIVSGNDNDIYCALKADGRVNCWAAYGYDFLFVPLNGYGWAGAIANAPPGLVQLSMTNIFSQAGGRTPYLLCGVDSGGQGSCWADASPVAMGQGLKAVILSEFGTCTLSVAGAITCKQQVDGVPPASQVWDRILPSEMLVAALDVTGAPYYPYVTFPSGTYVDIAANDAQRVAAVRSDGTVVSFRSDVDPVSWPGSFTRVAVDYMGDVCALDRAGEIACWSVLLPDAALTFTPPPGPFVKIVGGEMTFCALRGNGTTVCFGDRAVTVPAGW
jgi:hypothetical protein